MISSYKSRDADPGDDVLIFAEECDDDQTDTPTPPTTEGIK